MIVGPAGQVAAMFGARADHPVRAYFLDMYVSPIMTLPPAVAATALGNVVLACEVCGNVFRGIGTDTLVPEFQQAKARSSAGRQVYVNTFRMFVGYATGNWRLIQSSVSVEGENFDAFQQRTADMELVQAISAGPAGFVRIELYQAGAVLINPGQTGGAVALFHASGALPGDGGPISGKGDCYLAPRPPGDFVFALSRSRFVKVIHSGIEARISTHVFCQPGMPLCLYMPDRYAKASDAFVEMLHTPVNRPYVPRGSGPYLSYLMAMIRANAGVLANAAEGEPLVTEGMKDRFGGISGLPVRTRSHVDAVEGVSGVSRDVLRRLARVFAAEGLVFGPRLATVATVAPPTDEKSRYMIHCALWYSIIYVFESLTLGGTFFPGLLADELRDLVRVCHPIDLMAVC